MAAAYFASSKFLFGLTMLIAVALGAMDNIGTTVLARPLLHVPSGSPMISLAAPTTIDWVILRMLGLRNGASKACSAEIIQFFLNGETHLGSSCCRAIHVIQHSCWPAMLGSLGFTQEEGDILRGYCDPAANDNDSVRPPSPPSAIVPIVKGA
ncbi:hypothetical protein MKX01_041093 [Papaver californicum]|nr:hypothetical protein MKX01_041093 [Papaver californicum]